MKKFVYITIIALLIQSCAKQVGRVGPLPCEGEPPGVFAGWHRGESLHIRGSVRIDLPQYRLRGICTIRSTPAGDLRIDFHHSSLFGAYREDATLFLRGGRLGVFDRESGTFFGNDSTLAMLREDLGFNLRPDDLAQVLLFSRPDCAGIESPGLSGGGDSWRLSGIWRGRRIVIEGRGEGIPVRFTQCMAGDEHCYTVRYEYHDDAAAAAYPSRIVIQRENGPERLSLVVKGVKGESAGEELFELFDRVGR